MKTTTDQIVANYLERLEACLHGLPAHRRRELFDEIREHISEARKALDPDDEVGLRAILKAVGDPGAIAEEALGAAPIKAPSRSDPLVPWLVLLGGLLFGIGWLVGIVLLWSSATWRLRDKLLATLIVPGGLLFPALFLSIILSAPGVSLVPGDVIAFLLVTVLAVLFVAVHLDWVRRRA
jgi:hypothetical protein